MLALEEAFDRFKKSHLECVATLSKHRKECEDGAQHCPKKVEFDSNVKQWIDSASKVPEMFCISPEDSVSTAGLL